MTVKIDGTNGIDTAQLRAPDGDPVAMTIDALGKLAFPAQGQSLSANGYIKLPGGLIIQWGFATAIVSAGVQVIFPIPFPNAVGSVSVTPVAAGFTPLFGMTIPSGAGPVSSTYVWLSDPNGVNSAGLFSWIAIGY